MNKALTIVLKKNEIQKIMKRVSKCDRRIEHGIVGIVGQEAEADRKLRLLGRVTVLMTDLQTLEA